MRTLRLPGTPGGAKGRILQGSSNWFHGHYGGYAGVAWYDDWKTAYQNNVSPNTDWVVMCGTNAESQLKLVNGRDVGTATGGFGDLSLFVNAGRYPNEKSDFAIAGYTGGAKGRILHMSTYQRSVDM